MNIKAFIWAIIVLITVVVIATGCGILLAILTDEFGVWSLTPVLAILLVLLGKLFYDLFKEDEKDEN